MRSACGGAPTGQGRGERHRHRFGIAIRAFNVVDDFVFWAKGEDVLYVVPAAVLREAFNRPGETPTVLKDNQWQTDIYFAPDRREPCPTWYSAPIPLGEYARAIPADAAG